MYNSKVEYNVPGIPPAPVGRKLMQAADYDYMERKKRLAHRLPFYTKEEVIRKKHSYHVVLMHEMMTEGYFLAVQEMHKIFRKEETERSSASFGKSPMALLPPLVSQRQTVELIATNLKLCQDYTDMGNYEAPTGIRKSMGERFMREGVIWLAKHFLKSGLDVCTIMPESNNRDKLEAEIIVYSLSSHGIPVIIWEAMENAVDHLVICRTLAKDQTWQFKPRILSIRLKKPIALHGLRDEYEVVDGCSMTLYRVATLLEHEMLIGLANEILHLHHMHHRIPTTEELAQAHIFADNALELAYEVRQPVALSSALMRFGVVLRHTGAFDDAIGYFRQLAHHSEISGDQESYAIAHHNIAMCQTGKHESQEALMSLIRQKDVADMFNLEDLQADALQELGCILLQEGQQWEAEECYASAYEQFSRLEQIHKPPHSHCNNNLAMWGIAAGQRLWSRFAGLVRNDTYEDISALMEWKNRREALPAVRRPDYGVEDIEETFARYDPAQYLIEDTTEAGSSGEDRSLSPSAEEEDHATTDSDPTSPTRQQNYGLRKSYGDTDDDMEVVQVISSGGLDTDYTTDGFLSDYAEGAGEQDSPGDDIRYTGHKRSATYKMSRMAKSLGDVMANRKSLVSPNMF